MFWRITLPADPPDDRRRGHHAGRHRAEDLRPREGHDERRASTPTSSPTEMFDEAFATATSPRLEHASRCCILVAGAPAHDRQRPPRPAGGDADDRRRPTQRRRHRRARPPGTAAGREPVGAAHAPRPRRRSRPCVLWVLVIALDDPDPRPARVTRSGPSGRADRRAGGRSFTDPQFTLDNYRPALFDPPGGDAPIMWQHFLNSLAIAIPATIVPIADRRGRGLRLRVDALPGPRLALHRRGRADGRAAPDVARAAAAAVRRRRPPHRVRRDAHAVPRPRPRRQADRGVAHPHRASACRWPSSCCTTTSSSLPGDVFEAARDRRRRPLRDLLADRAAAVACRRWPRSPSSSSSGCGTTTSSRSIFLGRQPDDAPLTVPLRQPR